MYVSLYDLTRIMCESIIIGSQHLIEVTSAMQCNVKDTVVSGVW